jgi:hypothetical protein
MSNPNRPMTRHSRLRSGDSAKYAPRLTETDERSALDARWDVDSRPRPCCQSWPHSKEATDR